MLDRDFVIRVSSLFNVNADESWVDEIWLEINGEMQKHNTIECSGDEFVAKINELNGKNIQYEKKDIPKVLYCGIVFGNDWFICPIKQLKGKKINHSG